MAVSRIDLADVGSPEKLITELLKAEPDLPIPVPVEDLALRLDIQSIRPMTTPGFEGGLVTDDARSSGIILYNERSPLKRRRFTIAHELGHFLMPFHVPTEGGQFLCSLEEMYSLSRNEQDRRARMEAEANRFASLLLLPPPTFRKDVGRSKDPDLQDIVRLSRRYEVSKEATGRSYIQYREEPAALVVVHDGRVLRSYKNLKFPFVTARNGVPLPASSMLRRRRLDMGVASEIEEGEAAAWFDVAWGKKAPTLFEQVLPQQQGYALILLHLEQETENDDDDDPEENLTSRERYQRRMGRDR